MMSDIISELLRFFEKIDSAAKWSIEPDEAVEIALASADEYLSRDTVSDYTNSILEQLSGIGYDRLGDKVKFSLSGDEEDKIYEIFKNSDFCLKQ